MIKRILAILLTLFLLAGAVPAFAASGDGSIRDNDQYYSAVSELIASTWDDSFFGAATLLVGGSTLVVDGYATELVNEAEIVDGELILPAEVFVALGVKVAEDKQGLTLTKKGSSIEIIYGENSCRVNDDEVGMQAPAVLKNGRPVLPATVLGELGLGFEIAINEETREVTITNEFQMARLALKVKPGAPLPGNIGAAEVISGPDGLHICQFETEAQAKEAYEKLYASNNIVYVSPDQLVVLGKDNASVDSAFSGATPVKSPLEGFAPVSGPDATYTHMSWGVARIESDIFLDYLIANGKQNASVTVAVLDTGLDKTHPYFTGRYVTGRNMIANNDSPVDGHGHGTHVSGTIVDITIALPNVKIMPIKVLADDGYGSSVNIANGLRWAVDNGAKVANESLGGPCDPYNDDSIAYAVGKGASVVVSAGNHGGDSTTSRYCPAHNLNAITVASVDSMDRPAGTSGHGACVDVAAPGVSVLSTIPGNRTAYMSGTSMAAPHVSGAVALLLCDNPSLTPLTIQETIRASVDDWVSSANLRYGTGILNIGLSAGGLGPRITIMPRVIDIHITQTQQLAVEYLADGNVTNITSLASYSSSNPGVATVSPSGLVTPTGAGSTTITASYNGTSGARTVTVTNDNTRFEGAITVEPDVMTPVSVTASLQIRYFKFIPYTTGSYVIESFNRGSSDPYGYLYNSSRTLLAYNDDGGTDTLNFKITYTLTAGQTYYIGAGCYSSGTGSYTFKVAPPSPPPTGVTVSPTEATLTVNATRQLTATVTPSTATSTITWTSSNATVATVSATGLVTARAVGAATITARTVNGLTATCAITVPDTTPPVITLTGGSTVTRYRGNVWVEPGYTAIDNVDGNITSRVVVTGTVNTAVIGTYILTYTVSDNAGNIASVTRTVNVLPNTASFYYSEKGKAGTSYNYTLAAPYPCIATITPSGVSSSATITISIKDSAGNTVFSSAFSSTAPKTVNLAQGTYTVTMRIDNANGNVTVGMNITLVEIEPPPAPTLDRIEVNPPSVSLTVGAAQTVAVTAVYSDGSKVPVTSGASLSSSNTSVATVSGMTITAAAVGSATVTASYEGKTVGVPVTVNAPQPAAPTIALIGSAQIILHLGGSPYTEQGVIATDVVDGNISGSAVIVSNVDTTKAGNYTVTYTVTNSAGLSASITRQVRVIAPEVRTVPGATYNFAPKGKQGEQFNYNFAASAAGAASLTVTVPNKTTTTVTIKNSQGEEVFRETFTASATRSFQALPGGYTVNVKIDAANGNTTINLGIATPGGTELYFPLPEIPL